MIIMSMKMILRYVCDAFCTSTLRSASCTTKHKGYSCKLLKVAALCGYVSHVSAFIIASVCLGQLGADCDVNDTCLSLFAPVMMYC